MRILFVGPPLYGLLYPVLSLAQAFRVNGHEVLIASGGKFAQKAAEAGLVVFDAAPGFDSEAGYRRQEALRKENNIGTKMGNFSFFSEEMTDPLVAFAGQWRPDLIVYPPLGVVGPLIAAKYDIPVVMQTVGFGHTPWHIKGVTKSLSNAYRRHGVSATPRDLAWIDVTPPSYCKMTESQLSPCNTSRITAAPSGKNGGNVHLIASVFWSASAPSNRWWMAWI